jgi:catechol 2,3-dioxygenase-like lactoylglutathione lyase family enzyme
MQATGFNHVSVVARDLDESVRFYRELFNVEPLPSPNFGHRVQWLQVGTLQLHLFERPDEAPGRAHFALTVDDFEAFYLEAQRRGIFDTTTFAHHLIELPNRVVQCYIRDPSGNAIEIDWPDVTTLPDSITADLQKLADRVPQSDENLKATLFVDAGKQSATV